jgi:hypothetical protein
MADEDYTQEEESRETIKKLIEEANKALKDQVRLQSEVSRLNGQHITQSEQLARQYREELRLTQELNEIISANSDKAVEMVDTFKRQLFESQRTNQITLNSYKAQIRVLDEIKAIQIERTRLAGSTEESDKKELENLDEKLRKSEKFLQSQQRITAIQADGVRAGAGMVETLGNLIKLTPDLDQGIVGGLARASAELVTGEKSGAGLVSAFQGMGDSVAEMFAPGNLLAFFVSNTIELAVRMDQLTTSFVQTTGASREFNSVMVDTFDLTANLGVGLQDASEAFTSLFVNFTKFSTLAPQTQAQISATAAGLEKLGIDTRTTGDSFDFLVSGLGMGVTEAEKILKRFAVEGRQAGIPPQVLAQQFAALEPQLAAFGRQAPDIFMRTAKTAKSLGMEVGELGQNLFQLSSGLDTFDQAADKVATFNLALGGSFVNAFDLTMAAAEGPFAQLEMLRGAFDASGRSFENMGFFEQKMLADGFGISIKNLRAMLEGTLSPQEAMISQEEEFANMVSEATTAVDKLSAGVEKLAAFFAPLGEFLNSSAGLFAMYAAGVAGVGVIFSKFYTTLTTASTGLSNLGKAMQGAAGAQGMLNAATDASAVSTGRKMMADNASTAAIARRTEVLKFDQATMTLRRVGIDADTASTGRNTVATEANTVVENQNIVARNGGAAASIRAAFANMTLAGALKMVTMAAAGVMAIFGIMSVMDTAGIDNMTQGIILLGVAVVAVLAALGDFSAGVRSIAAGAAFAAGAAGLMKMFGGNTKPKVPQQNVISYDAASGVTSESITGMQAGDAFPSFRSGGDNISSSFIAGEGPSPRGEFVQPMSVIKAQESGNLARSLQETGVALRQTRKDDGQFDKMVKMLEKIAGNTEQKPNQKPVEVALNIGGRQFDKAVVNAMNGALE